MKILTPGIVAMVLVAVLVIIALVLGHDGAVLTSGIAIIAGLGGYQVGTRAATKDKGPTKDQ